MHLPRSEAGTLRPSDVIAAIDVFNVLYTNND